MATTESLSAAMATMHADIDKTKGDIQQEFAASKGLCKTSDCDSDG